MQIAFHSQEIPSTIGQLKLLKSLNLDKNQIRRIPGDVLQGCDLLQTLSLHSNPITAQVHTILAPYAFGIFTADLECLQHCKLGAQSLVGMTS